MLAVRREKRRVMSDWQMVKFGFLFFAGAYMCFLLVVGGMLLGILVARGVGI